VNVVIFIRWKSVIRKAQFAKAFNCELTIWEIREHWLHTRQQLDILYSWIDNKIQTDE